MVLSHLGASDGRRGAVRSKTSASNRVADTLIAFCYAVSLFFLFSKSSLLQATTSFILGLESPFSSYFASSRMAAITDELS